MFKKCLQNDDVQDFDVRWDQAFQKYKGRDVLRGVIVKDDSGASAVFTEQGSSASQITAAKVMDVIARLPDRDGQAADALSANTQVKLEDAPRLFKIPMSECPDVRIRLPRHKWPKSWSNIEDPVVPLERFFRTPISKIFVGKTIRGSVLGTWMGKVPNWECLFVHRKQGLLLSVCVDDIKKRLERSRMWLPCGRNQ